VGKFRYQMLKAGQVGFGAWTGNDAVLEGKGLIDFFRGKKGTGTRQS
jgi:hypothetical protein